MTNFNEHFFASRRSKFIIRCFKPSIILFAWEILGIVYKTVPEIYIFKKLLVHVGDAELMINITHFPIVLIRFV